MSKPERVILITGANGGLGKAIATAFLKEDGSNFAWLGVRGKSENVKELKATFPETCESVNLEVSAPSSWKAAVDQILAKHGRLDVLVNNAGTHADYLLALMPTEAWNRVIATNLDGTFYGCQAVLQTMIGQRSGRIVNISSLSGLFPPPGQTNYAAAKAGIVALTQSLAKEVARINITVNVICPGFIETDLFSQLSEEERKLINTKIPMRRFGRPEEVAAAVTFLACPSASYITGSVLKIDGGIF